AGLERRRPPDASRPLMDADLVLLDIDAASRAEAIKTLVDRLYATGRTNAPHALEQAVWQREHHSATGVGFGCAVPHCKSDFILSNSVAVARLRRPIAWDEHDEEPTRIVFLLAVRTSSAAKEYMDVLKTLAVKIMDEQFRSTVLLAHDSQ